MKYKHLFGPVPSRRLGISLGVDLVPHKVCSQDCIYCEVGKTTNLTIERKEYVPVDDVIKELDHFLSTKPVLDYITFSGAGEPTLNSGLGKIISFIKSSFPDYKLALITNSNLLHITQLQNEIAPIDLLLPSLDAGSESVFIKINKPFPDLTITQMIEGLKITKTKIKGEMWLEIFLLPGLNDSQKELRRLKEACKIISPEKIQLNTLDRPGVEANLKALSIDRLNEICHVFEPLPVEIISKAALRKKTASYKGNIENMILETISRRPCTDKDLCMSLGLHINEINKYLGSLLAEGKIGKREGVRGTFFEPASS